MKLLIDTPRLQIRNLKLSDLPQFHAYRSDPQVTKYQGFDVFSREQAQNFIIDNAEKTFGKPGDWVQYGIEDKSTGMLIGDCAIRFHEQDSRLGEIGMTISPDNQRKGFGKEAVIAILRLLFSIDGFHRIAETVDAENVASIRLLKSVGFREEGHFIQNIFFKGDWGSEYQFAMLKSEWLQLLQSKTPVKF
jgi:RimJ/RimL family protein N-acetyltransferase